MIYIFWVLYLPINHFSLTCTYRPLILALWGREPRQGRLSCDWPFLKRDIWWTALLSCPSTAKTTTHKVETQPGADWPSGGSGDFPTAGRFLAEPAGCNMSFSFFLKILKINKSGLGWPAGYSQTELWPGSKTGLMYHLNLEGGSLLNRGKASGRTALPNQTAPRSVKSDRLSLTHRYLLPVYLPLKSHKNTKTRKGTGHISIDMTGAEVH